MNALGIRRVSLYCFASIRMTKGRAALRLAVVAAKRTADRGAVRSGMTKGQVEALFGANAGLRRSPKESIGTEMMRKIRYGVAMSLDGYIAGPNGETDWIGIDPEIDFAAIWAQFDTLLMGRRTYDAAVKRLGASAFTGFTSVVFSRILKQQDHPKKIVMPELSADWVRALKSQPGKDIWLMGGGEVFRCFLGSGHVDQVDVTVIPVLLGAGIPLLPPPYTPARLSLLNHKVYRSGRLSLTYGIKN